MKRTRTFPRLILVVCVCLLAGPQSTNSQGKRPFTVRDSIEISEFVHSYGTNPVSISPDGKRYLVVLERGDLSRNGCWVELLSGSTSSLDIARNGRVISRLFSKSTAPVEELVKDVRWLGDSEHVAFLWDDGSTPRRLVSVNVLTHKVATLAHYASPIAEYDISRDGQTIVFDAQSIHSRSADVALARGGFAVTDQSLWAVLEGDLDGWRDTQHYDTFVLSKPKDLLSKIREPEITWNTPPTLIRLSRDGSYAITVRPVLSVPAEWDGYTDHIFKDDFLRAARLHPEQPNLIRQYSILDTRNHSIHALWDAPQNPTSQVVWSPDSKTVVVGPTFLPLPSTDPAGVVGHALAEVDVKDGHYLSLPEALENGSYRPMRWTTGGVLYVSEPGVVGLGKGQEELRKKLNQWIGSTPEPEQEPAATQIELRQDLNTPPSLYAVDRMTGTAALVLDPNPQLKQLTLGRVELVHWRGTDGRPWTGILYYPVHYETDRAFPLVIQTHGYSPDDFQPDGAFSTVFAAQALANQGMAVLQVGNPDGSVTDFSVTPREPAVYVAGFEGAIDHFVASGLADRARVGIVGFSRTGWHVEYMLTHSRYQLAAAEVADNIDVSYVQYVLSDGAVKSEFEADNGGQPIGDGIETWMHVAPGFEVDKIRTPLRMEIDSGGIDSILRDWEVFGNLRYLRRPVELFVIPNVEHGAHILQNPAQRLASEQGTVDWFCFWLENREVTDPANADEYRRWRLMKKLQN